MCRRRTITYMAFSTNSEALIKSTVLVHYRFGTIQAAAVLPLPLHVHFHGFLCFQKEFSCFVSHHLRLSTCSDTYSLSPDGTSPRHVPVARVHGRPLSLSAVLWRCTAVAVRSPLCSPLVLQPGGLTEHARTLLRTCVHTPLALLYNAAVPVM